MGHILLINVFSTLNKGDAAIAMSQIAAIRKAQPGREIVVQSWNPGTDAPRLDCPVVGPFFDMVSEKHPEYGRVRRIGYIANIFLETMRGAAAVRRDAGSATPRLSAEQKEAFAAYKGADLIVSVGGNFLYAYPGKNSFSFLKHCHQIWLAQSMGKPTVLLAQSIGPVEAPLFRSLLRRIVNRSTKTWVREQWSLDFLKKLGVDLSRVAVTQDSAFLLEPAPPEEGEQFLRGLGLPSGKPCVGMTVRNWEFPHAADGEAANEAFKSAIAETIDWMAATWNANIVLLPQCISPDQDDRLCMRDVYRLVRDQSSVRLVEDDLPPILMKSICGRMDLFIGTRMHSNIFATAMTTPTLAISYQPKTDGIMGMLEMSHWKISIDDVTAERLKDLLGELWANSGEVRAHLQRRIAEIQDQAFADIETSLASADILPPAAALRD